MFEAEVPNNGPAAGYGHREPRKNLLLAASVEAGQLVAPVRIRNMSEYGAMIDGPALPEVGSTLVLRRLQVSVPAQVGGIDAVVVDQHERADARAGEILQRRRADPAEADEHHLGPRQRRLPGAADLGQHDMAGETVEAVG